jgi:N-acetyl-beta-hexosaminidase
MPLTPAGTSPTRRGLPSASEQDLTDVVHSFPLVLPSLPSIAAKGAYDAASTYSPADVKAITRFANSKGIDVIIEFDNPGHTGALAHAYPDVVDCWQADWLTYALEPPAGQLEYVIELLPRSEH